MKKLAIISIYWLVVVTTGFGQEIKDSSSVKHLITSYYDQNFTPFSKGNIQMQFVMSFSNKEQINESNISQEIINGDEVTYDINFGAGYYFADNFAVGLNFGVGKDDFEGTTKETIDTLTRSTITTSYSLTPYLRTAIPLTENQRLSLFVDLSLGYGWGSTDDKKTNWRTGEIEETSSNNINFSVGINPGVVFFVMEDFAIQLGVNVLGYNYNQSTLTDADGIESKITNQEVDFKINLLELQLGLTYYL
jgi:hypothetical protein